MDLSYIFIVIENNTRLFETYFILTTHNTIYNKFSGERKPCISFESTSLSCNQKTVPSPVIVVQEWYVIVPEIRAAHKKQLRDKKNANLLSHLNVGCRLLKSLGVTKFQGSTCSTIDFSGWNKIIKVVVHMLKDRNSYEIGHEIYRVRSTFLVES